MGFVGNLAPLALFDKLDEFLLEFQEHDREVYGGVLVEGPAAAYAEVWEWGNMRQTKPGPRTVIGTNPNGQMVWLSSQAPFGFIRINEATYWQIIEDELRHAKFSQPNAAAMTQELEKVVSRAAKKMAGILHDFAPEDTGELRSDFRAADPHDSLLTTDVEDFGPLTIEGTGG